MKPHTDLYLFMLMLLPLVAMGQPGNLVENGSLELSDSKRKGWIIPKTMEYNHPDIFLAIGENPWQVDKLPYDGASYTGLVVRDDASYEVLGQKLKHKLLSNKKYMVSFYLCTSTKMKSMSPHSRGRLVRFSNPISLRFNIGASYQLSKLVYETGEVSNENWMEYKFEFKPEDDVNFFWIESAPSPTFDKPYNGNVFIDKISIKEIE
jgi:hypothetical protein